MSLKIKSYFAPTVEAAMSSARQELGSDAMLLNSSKTDAASSHLGRYEVVFALPPECETNQPAPAPGHEAHPAGLSTPMHALSEELAQLRKQMEQMAGMLSRPSGLVSSQVLGRPEMCQLLASLEAQDIEAPLARQLTAAVQARLEPLDQLETHRGTPARASKESLRQALAAELDAMVQVAAVLGRQATRTSDRRVVALVGPPGSGKTCTLVKLAANYGLGCKRPALILSVDSERVAAAEQLRSYATILGIGFHLLDSPTTLSQALEEFRNKELILIDTPGYSPSEMEYSSVLARSISCHPDVDTHLVLSATSKAADLRAAVERYETFRPAKFIFTQLDETSSFGPLLNEIARTRKPVSFVCGGQRVPDDIKPATRAMLVELFSGQAAASAAAA